MFLLWLEEGSFSKTSPRQGIEHLHCFIYFSGKWIVWGRGGTTVCVRPCIAAVRGILVMVPVQAWATSGGMWISNTVRG